MRILIDADDSDSAEELFEKLAKQIYKYRKIMVQTVNFEWELNIPSGDMKRINLQTTKRT